MYPLQKLRNSEAHRAPQNSEVSEGLFGPFASPHLLLQLLLGLGLALRCQLGFLFVLPELLHLARQLGLRFLNGLLRDLGAGEAPVWMWLLLVAVLALGVR